MMSYLSVAPLIWPLMLASLLVGVGVGVCFSLVFGATGQVAEALREQAAELATARETSDAWESTARAAQVSLSAQAESAAEAQAKLESLAGLFLRREQEHEAEVASRPGPCDDCPRKREPDDLDGLDGVTPPELALIRGRLAVTTRAQLVALCDTAAKRKSVTRKTTIPSRRLAEWARQGSESPLTLVEGGKKPRRRKAA